jgi:hypothetical protein
MEGARVIEQMSAGDEKGLLSPDHICLNHPSTFHSLLITLVLSSDHICLYHPNTFHSLLIKLVSSPDDICFITRAPSIPS